MSWESKASYKQEVLHVYVYFKELVFPSFGQNLTCMFQINWLEKRNSLKERRALKCLNMDINKLQICSAIYSSLAFRTPWSHSVLNLDWLISQIKIYVSTLIILSKILQHVKYTYMQYPFLKHSNHARLKKKKKTFMILPKLLNLF